ncbi:MAG: DUF2188 domain-containing protein [Janthinobacterium lividum]
MFYDDANEAVFKVLRGKDGRWEVTQRALKKPLGRFDRMDDAMQYARDVMAEQRRADWLNARHA